MIELLDRRALGALEFVSAVTSARVLGPLRVSAAGARIAANRSGLYVIHQLDALDEHSAAFAAPPSQPPALSLPLEVEVSDPAGHYSSRRCALALPRRDVAFDQADSLLAAVRFQLYPAVSHRPAAGWAVLRARVLDRLELPIRNALLQVQTDEAGARGSRAITDANGEALLFVAGVPPLVVSATPLGFSATFPARVEVVVDLEVAGLNRVPDPDRIAQRRLAAAPGVAVFSDLPVQLSGGDTRSATFEVEWP